MDEDSLPPEEQKERKIMKLLLKIKNGTPPMRKVSCFPIFFRSTDFHYCIAGTGSVSIALEATLLME